MKGRFFLFFYTIIIFATILLSCDSVNKKTESDYNHYQNLIGKADKFLKTNPDSAIIYADSAIAFSKELSIRNDDRFPIYKVRADALISKGLSDSACNIMERDRYYFFEIQDTLSLAKAIAFLGVEEMNKGRLYLAEKRMLDALKLFKKLNKAYEQSQILRRYGILLTRRGENKKSQDYLFQALQFAQLVDSVSDAGSVCHNIGNNYADMGDKKEALKYYRMAEQAAISTASFENQIKILVNIGILYRKTQPDSAFYFYNHALEIEKQHPNKRLYINLMYNIALLYHDRGELSKAVHSYRDVLGFCIAEKIYPGQTRAYRGLAEAYSETGDLNNAILYMERALVLSDSTGETSSSPYYMEKLALYYEKTGNFAQANQIAKKELHLKDSLSKLDKVSAFKELEILNQIQHNELEYDRVSQELASQKTKQLLRFLLIAILGISTFILSWSLYRTYRLLQQRKQAYAVLMGKYEEERNRAKATLKNIPDEDVILPEFSETDPDPLIAGLIKYYRNEKPYLDTKLKLATIIRLLSTNEKALAAALKTLGDYNFNSFTNRFRVEHAKRMMENPQYRNYKIVAIGTDSGFGSRMSFYNAFSQFTGVSPSYHRNYLLTREVSDFKN